MKRYLENSTAPAGIYVSIHSFDVRVNDGNDTRLVGKPGAEYFRIPFAALVVAGPVLGALFAMAFPFVVFAALLTGMSKHAAAARTATKTVHTWQAGQAAREGVYVATNRLAVRHVSAPQELLPGDAGTRYLRVPTLLLLLCSPAIGALYVVTFPFVAAATLAVVLFQALYDAGHQAWEDHMHLADLRWTPAMANLVPEKKPESAPETVTENAATTETVTQPAALEPDLNALDAEVEARRAAEREV